MSKRKKLILLALPTLLAIIIVIFLLNWHIPTLVRISLTANKISFKTGGTEKATILDSVGLKSVVIEKFGSIKLKPASLSLFGQERGPRLNRGAGNAITNLTIEQLPVVLTPRAGRSQSNITFAPAISGPRSAVMIDALNANPSSEISIEDTEDLTDLILRVDGQQSSGNVSIAEPFKLAIDQTEIAGIANSVALTQPLTLKATLIRDSAVEFISQENSLILTLTVPEENTSILVPQGHLLITGIKFEELDQQSGKVLSSLTKDSAGEISYPDYDDKIGKATITKPDFLWLDDLRDFSIEELTYNPGKRGISVKLFGVANKITSGSAEYSKDLRLTAYTALWNNYKLVAVFVVLCWVAGTTAAFYKFVKES